MFATTMPYEVVTRAPVVIEDLKPFDLPAAGEDKKFVYVRTIKQDSPIANRRVGPICFEKFCINADASLSSNRDKPIERKLPLVTLTEKQARYIQDRISKQLHRIPAYDNPKWRNGVDNGEVATVPEQVLKLSEHLILEKYDDYVKTAVKLPSFDPSSETIVTKDAADEFREEIIKAQQAPQPKKK